MANAINGILGFVGVVGLVVGLASAFGVAGLSLSGPTQGTLAGSCGITVQFFYGQIGFNEVSLRDQSKIPSTDGYQWTISVVWGDGQGSSLAADSTGDSATHVYANGQQGNSVQITEAISITQATSVAQGGPPSFCSNTYNSQGVSIGPQTFASSATFTPSTTWVNTTIYPSFVYTAGTATGGGQVFNFTDHSAVSGGDSIKSYSWNFDDGFMGTGSTVLHTFTRSGTYEVTETLVDSRGLNFTATQPVNVSLPASACGNGIEPACPAPQPPTPTSSSQLNLVNGLLIVGFGALAVTQAIPGVNRNFALMGIVVFFAFLIGGFIGWHLGGVG